jgi:hypothetical protein
VAARRNDKWNFNSKENVNKSRVIVGSKTADNNTGRLKVSSKPRQFHLYIGNLEIGTTIEDIRSHCSDAGIRVLEFELVRSLRYTDVRAAAAHVIIDLRDKDKVMQPGVWFEDVVIRPWRIAQRKQNDGGFSGHKRNDWDDWGLESNWHLPMEDNE